LELGQKRRPNCSSADNPPPRILVAGGAGFIGSHLVQRLVFQGHRSITVLDNLIRGRTANLAAVWHSIRFVSADIRDWHTLDRLVQNTDLIFHLAAQSNVIGAVEDLDYSSSTNIVGTAAILQAAHAAGVRRVVFTSSREVYGDPADLPVPETAPLRPKNAYGMSKVAGEMCCRMSMGQALETVVLRLANVYGPRDRGRVIPLFVENALKGRPLTVYGGNQVLDFVYVDHVVDALMKAGFERHIADPVNIGSGRGTSIAELAERILQLTDSGSKVSWMPSRDLDVVGFVADTTKARTLLGLEYPSDPLYRLPELIALSAAEIPPAQELSRGVAV
jgi:UDP-glucose 4-epimerase